MLDIYLDHKLQWLQEGLSKDYNSELETCWLEYHFFLHQSPLLSLWTFFDAILSNMDKVLVINAFLSVFVFGDFNVHYKDWLILSGRSDRPGELSYNFSIWNDLTQMVIFPTRILDCDSDTPKLLSFFLFSDASTCSTVALYNICPPVGKPHHVVDFPSIWKEDVPFHRTACDYSRDHLRDVSWKDVFKLACSAASTEIFLVGPGWNWWIYPSL